MPSSCGWRGGEGTWRPPSNRLPVIDLPVTGRSDGEIALAGDLRAAALMNLGIVEAWSLRLPDAERHLGEGAALARRIGRPYLEVGCLAELSYASKGRSFATAIRRCREAIALAERHGWGTEPVVAPALVTLADRLIWMAELDEGEMWLRRASHALRSDAGPGIRMLLHLATGMLRAARGSHHEALEEFTAADGLRSRLAVPPTLASEVTGWLLAAQARAGEVGAARAALATVPADPACRGEVSTAEAVIRLADGDPAGALIALEGRAGRYGSGRRVRDGRRGPPARRARPSRARRPTWRRTRRSSARWNSPSPTG